MDGAENIAIFIKTAITIPTIIPYIFFISDVVLPVFKIDLPPILVPHVKLEFSSFLIISN
jgi:hypothetical protein